jgi:ubiquinone/menaquinone biosynthesis C-methylase UbiE
VTSRTNPDDHTHHQGDHSRHPYGHAHGHHHDRGLRAVLRYIRLLPLMWRSELNDAVVRHLALKPGELVVDLGAGMGAATVKAAQQGAQVIAVDPMPFMRAVLLLRRLGHGGRKTITVQDGAAEAIPARDQTVDGLWTVNTLHHWTDREAASRELARVLKPGGRVLLLDEDFDDPSHPEHDHIRASRTRSGLVFEEVDPDALAYALRAAGFAHAEGSRTRFAGRPVKQVSATR